MPSELRVPPSVWAGLCAGLLLLMGNVVSPPSGWAQSADAPVQSVLRGTVTVNPEIDSTADYSGFELLVIQQAGNAVDTLGQAVTDRSGQFEMAVAAPERDVYPLIIRRRGTVVASDDYVAAPGDTATMRVQMPVGNRPLPIRSPENSAWMAYRNTLSLHRQGLIERVQADTVQASAMGENVQQTASILWSMENSYANTLGAAYARAEAVTLLAGWDDSLAVARAREIAPTNPRFVEVAQTARRAQARLDGQESALKLVRDFQARAQTNSQRAALQAEIVRAHVDSLEQDAALEAAQQLITNYPNSRWADWADRTTYEIENLMPGMPAPEFSVTTWNGARLDLADLQGRPVVLEFYQPSNQLYQKQIPTRKALYEDTRPADLALVSVSLQPDTLLNEGFFEGRELPGIHVVAPEEVARSFVSTYNLGSLPTRFVIDAEGNIVGKYVGSAFVGLREDLRQLLGDILPAEQSSQ